MTIRLSRAILLVILGGSVAAACALQPATGAKASSNAASEPENDVAAILERMRQLYPRAKAEYAFARFLEGLQVGDRALLLPWDKVNNALADYHATALTIQPLLASYIGPKAKLQDAKKMRKSLDYASAKLDELETQHAALAQSVLKEVFGVNAQTYKDLLAESGSGEESDD